MTDEQFEFYQKKALRFILLSLIHNTNSIPDITDDQKEAILDSVFNIILNSLKPDAAYIWNEEILSLSQTQQNVSDIMDILRKDFSSQ